MIQMNKRQKAIRSMWLNYSYNCKFQNLKPDIYRKFKWSFGMEDMEQILEMKEWYKKIRI